MGRSRWAPGRGVALSVATGLLAVGCAAAGPVTGPAGVTSTAPATPKAQATSKAQATDPGPAATTAQAARPAPTGFWSGSDSWPVPVGGSAPYRMPGIGGAYGGYVGMTGSW